MASDDVWLVKDDISSINESTLSVGNEVTTAAGEDTTITSPTVEGDYHLYIVDEAGNISSPSTAKLTVDNTPPPNQNAVFDADQSLVPVQESVGRPPTQPHALHRKS